ncbi:CoA-dependent acyltransferase, partial [Caulochytrium protostelioides]
HGDHAQNRWFDTCLQFIVANSGRAGLNGEHTPCDAMIPSRLFHHIVEQEHATDPLVSARHDGYPLLPRLEAPQPLTFRTDAAIDALIADAQREADRAIAGVEVAMLETHVYGARYMKEVAKTSPDSFVQMALQLAYYRLHGAPTAVYETAATRGFAHGRTETGRSLSSESLDFCAAFDNDDVSYEVKRDLLREAVAAHQQWMREAGAGHGSDRHFLGLAEMRRPDEPVPELLAQPVFARSKTFHLSTSNVSPGRAGYSGFGPGTADGYGCNYAIDTDAIRISISANRASRVAQPYRYGDELVRALKDLMILFAKPSEVWGKDWKTRHQQDRTHARDAAVMADLNRDYMRLESKLSEKYRRVER